LVEREAEFVVLDVEDEDEEDEDDVSMLFDVGAHMNTAACRMFLLPSHRSFKIRLRRFRLPPFCNISDSN